MLKSRKNNPMIKGFITVLFVLFFEGLYPQHPFIQLTINNESAVTVYKDQPLLFRLVLSNPVAAENFSWNLAAHRRIRELDDSIRSNSKQRDQYLAEKDEILENIRPLDTFRLGSTSKPWFENISWILEPYKENRLLTWPLKVMAFPLREEIILLDAHAQASICYGLDPETVSTLNPGLYKIRVRLGNTFSTGISINILDKPMPPSLSNLPATLIQLGNYFLQAGQTAKAIAYAQQILLANPGSLDGSVLLADGFYRNGRLTDAVEWYQKAYELYYKLNGKDAEAPAYLLTMLSLLRQN